MRPEMKPIPRDILKRAVKQAVVSNGKRYCDNCFIHNILYTMYPTMPRPYCMEALKMVNKQYGTDYELSGMGFCTYHTVPYDKIYSKILRAAKI